MKKMFLSMACTIACAAFVWAGNYEDVLKEAEQVINERYTFPRSRKSAEEKLDEIINDKNLSQEDKITRIRQKFLMKSEAITERSAYNLVYTPLISWKIHSVSIGYDIDETTQILVSEESLASSETAQTDSSEAEKRKQKSTGLEKERGGKVSADAEISASINPFKFHANADVQISGIAAACEKTNETDSGSEVWSKRSQNSLSSKYDETIRTLTDKKISKCHLRFSVTIQNHTDIDLQFNPAKTYIPVYAREFILNAKPDDVQDIQDIPANTTKEFLFRGEINNTKAVTLLSFMRHDAPSFSPERGQFKISSTDGRIKDAIADSRRIKTCSVFYKNKEWKIRKAWNGKQTTLREAIWAINALYAPPLPFQTGEDGAIKSMFGAACNPSAAAEWNLNQYPVWRIGSKWKKPGEAGELNQPLPDNGVFIKLVNIFDMVTTGGRDYDPDLQKMLADVLKSASEQNVVRAQYSLGDCYYCGFGVEKDPKEAVNWYRKAAEQGNAWAQFSLGDCYYNGIGVEKDPQEAVKWYRKSAEQGNAWAQFILGNCYYNGEGVEKDPKEAVKWYQEAVKRFRKAAEQGNELAQFNLGYCYYNGIGVEKDPKEAVKWYRKSAEQGNARAQYRLGDCYYMGIGVEKDPKEVVKWYRKSAEQGYREAQQRLLHMEGSL